MMKKSILNRVQIVFALLLVLMFSGMSFALSGNGTESSPYLISSPADLKTFAQKVNSGEQTACAKLTADIDLNPGKTILNSDGTLYNNGADLEEWVRIGAYTTRHYAGTFDGQGHTISGVYINASALDNVGLFGFIGEGGLVKNFGVKNSYICGRAFVGGIVAVNNGTVRDVHYEGTLIGTDSNVGGVAGTNAGAISNVYKTGLVKHGNFGDWVSSIGGVVGHNLGTVTGSYNTGDVIVSSYSESGQNVGGVVGANSGTVSDVYNTGSVSVKNTLSGYGGQNIGGVVGKNEVGDNKGSGVVNGAYNAGTVSGANIVGGVVGLNEKSAEVRNVYNIGAVDGGKRPVSMLVTFVIGGLIGYNYGYATLAYNNGVVTSSGYYGNDGAVGAGNNVSFGYYNMEECPDCQANGSYGLETLDLASLDVAKGFPGSEKTWIPGSVEQISLTEYKIQLPGILNLGVQPEMVYKFEPNADGVYEIKSAQQLRWFAKLVNSGKNSIKGKLVRDIVLNSEVYFLEVPQWDPIGTYGCPFIGSFDGDGHTIEGLYFDNVNQNYVGLFGYVGSNGEVKKVSLKNSHIKGNVCVGGIAGTSNGAITGVSNASGVSGVEDVGGIVGCNEGLVRDVHNTGNVNGDDEIGGVVGLNDAKGEVSDASNAGVMQGGQGVGGVVGTNRGSVSKAYNARTVHGTNATGGVIGGNEGSVNSVYNEGTLNGDKGFTGGVVGINNGGSISDAFNTGAVEKTVYSTSCVGGVVGALISGSVKNVYNTGLVSDNFAENEVPVAGVVVGQNGSGTIENAYYNTDLACSGCNTSFGTGKTTVELASKTLLTGFSSSIWGVGSGEPVVEEEKLVYKLIYLKGVGTQPEVEYAEFQPNASGVYEISTAKELFLFAEIVNKSKKAVNGKLTRDIVLNKDVLKADGSLSGNYASFTKWTPIGTKNNPFIGQFDGDGNAVYGLYFSDVNKDTVGLFGYVGINGKVMNVGVKDSYIEGGDYVGGVVGFNDGSVSKVYNEGTMKGGSYVGGVVGAGSVSEAYNTGLVNGSSNVGGVIGESQKAVGNAYNTGSVSGSSNVGGVVGRNAEKGFITNVYSVGDVHLIKKSAYNANLAGLVIGSAVSSKVENAYYSKEVVCENCGTLSLGTEMSIAELTNGALPAGFSSDIWVAGSVESLLSNGKLKCLLPGLRNVDTQLEFVYSFQSGAEDVLEISSAEQLYWFAKVVNFGKNSIKAKLTANIEVNQNVLKDDGSLSENYSSFKKWTPIGTFENPFLGTFDGQNYTISGLYFDNEKQDYAGLFGYVGSDGKVMNVGVEKSYIKGNAFVGGVVGTNMGSVKGVYNTGSVNGGDEIGGVAGHNGGSVSDAHNAGLVNGKAQVGGVVGTNDVDGLVNTVYNKGTVDGVQEVGGVIGDNSGTVDNAYNDNFVNGTGVNIGGVVGYNGGGSVNSVHNAGELSAVSNVGGVAGILMSGSIKDAYNMGKMSCKTGFIGGVVGGMLDGSVENAYNKGSMSGYSAIGIYAGGVVGKMAGGSVNKAYNAGSVYDGAEIVGGLVGFMDGGSVENAYNTGSMSGSFETVGGLVGSMRGGSVKYAYNTGLVSGGKNVAYVVGESTSGKIENAYYNKDVECSKCNTSSGTGKTSAELASKTLLTGFSKDIWEGGSDSPVISGVKLVYKLTYLKKVGSQPEIEYADFQPNEDGVFEISSVQQLYWFAELVNSVNGSFKGKLTKSIVVNEKVLTEEGKLSENYPSFKKWTPIGTSSQPFVGIFDGGGNTISGLYFNNTNKDSVGLFGVVGSKGEVKNVGVKDSYFNGKNYVGSIVGYNSGTINDVYNTGTVSGTGSYVGGIVGDNYGTINDVYNTGAVSGTGGYVGGIAGSNNVSATINDVYNTGAVSGTGDYVGRVVGRNNGGSVNKAYYNKNVSCSKCNYFTGTGKTTWELATATLTELFTTTDAWVAGAVKSDLGNGKISVLLPGLKNVGDRPEMECNGFLPNADGVYEISSAQKLKWFSNFVNEGHTSVSAKLTANITLNPNKTILNSDGTLYNNGDGLESWIPIGTYENPFTGTFDGNNRTISGLYFNDDTDYYIGLFGCIGDSGKVMNVGVVDSYINGDRYVGGVVAKNDGSVSNSYNAGVVRGDQYVGGVAGLMTASGSISNVYNVGSVFGGEFYVGGVAGYIGGSVSNLYNTGSVSATGNYVGGVVGHITSGDSIKNAYNTGSVNGNDFVGGVVGFNRGSVSNVNNDGVVEGGNSVGGVAGNAEEGSVTASFNTGAVNGSSSVGGVVGHAYGASVSKVYNTGAVNGSSSVGGVVGHAYGASASKVYNTGSVNGNISVGGVTGLIDKSMLSDTYNTGLVNGIDSVGGLVGKADLCRTDVGSCVATGIGNDVICNLTCDGSVSNSYNAGVVQGNRNVGRVIGGTSASNVYNCYYIEDVACENCSNTIGSGKQTFEMAGATLPAGFSSDIWVAGSVESLLDDGKLEGLLPGLKNVGSRPKFAFEIPLSYVYEISNADQLYWFAKVVNVGRTTFHAKLTADIVVNKNVLKADGSLSDDYKNFIPWTPIGSYQPYTGNFDGAGHTISGLYFDDVNQDKVGLFGYVGSPGQVKNVGVEDSYFRGHWYVGGVVGYNRFSIINVYNTGVVKGILGVGGVVGYNSQGYVNDVYNTGMVVGDSGVVGGIFGYGHSGSISNVYNSGVVSGTGGNVGRVIGYKSSGSVTNAYYNSDIACSSCNNSIGTGKTAVELANTILPDGFSSEVWGVGSGQLVVSNGKLVYKLPYLLNVGNQHEFAVLQPNAEGVFEISSAQELTWFAKLVNSGETSIKGKLTQNIVVNQNVLNANGSLNTGNLSNFSIWTPIGTQNQPFNGSFDGAGYTISGLYVLGDNYAGLFGYVGSSGKVEKVGVEKSYVSGKYYVGSIVGYNKGSVRNVYNTSVVSGSNDDVGGVAGYVSASGSVENAYNTGSVSGTGDYIGGAIGKNDGSVSNVYYSTDVVSSSASIEGVTGLTSAKLASKTLPEGFSSDIWVPGSGEPVVSNGKKVYKLPGFVASGTQPEIGWVFGPNADGIYEISSANELSKFAKIVNGGQTSVKGKLTANIVVNKNVLKADGSLSGNSANFTQWTPIGTSENPFVGTFDGAGYTVSGLYINEAKANYVGLFGSVGSKGSVMNVGVEDSYFMGEKLVGGVVGYNTGSVSKVYNTGSVNGTELVGGVVGLNIAEISDVYNTGSVEGAISIGGVAGGSDGSIVNAYNTGSVAGSNEVGGVAGYNAGNISNSFFNKEVYTGNAVGSGNAGTNVLGKTTAELASKTLPEGFSSSVWVAGSGEQPVLSNGQYVYRLPGLAGVGSRPKVEYTEFQPNSDGVYEISSVQQFYMFAKLVNGGETTIKGKLTTNIVLNENVLKADGSLSDGFASFTQWTPIGTSAKPFAGTFDGAGYTISGLYFNDANADYVGFFGYVDSTGKIMNVGVEDSYVMGKNYVGGIVGYSKKGVISGVYNTGSVNGGNYVGGVAGRLSVATASLRLGDFIVRNVYNTGFVSGNVFVGGVAGGVSAPVASGTGRLTQSDFAYAIDNAFNIGQVEGSSNVGRVIGLTSTEGIGVVGNEPSFKITHTYYNTDVACTNCNDSFGAPKTTVELASRTLPSGFSDTIWVAGSGEPVASNGKLVYKLPGLKGVGTQPEVEYTGSSFGENGVYAISSAEELLKFAEIVNNEDASVTGTLIADIVLNKNVLNANGTLSSDSASFTQWTPIGSGKSFTGTFDGNGHIISGLYFNDESKDSVGLFGKVGVDGRVMNVGVEDSYIKGKKDVGGVVGSCSRCFVSNVYNAGVVQGNQFVGGVVGDLFPELGGANFAISNAYNTGAVNGNTYVGGVLGGISSRTGTNHLVVSALVHVYNTGSVTVATEGAKNSGYVVGGTIYLGTDRTPVIRIGNAYYNTDVACTNCGYSTTAVTGKTSVELAQLDVKSALSDSTGIWSAGSIDNGGDHVTYNYPRLTVFGDRSQPKSSPAVVIAADGGSATIYGAAMDAVNITSDIEVTGPVSFKREFPNLATASSFSSIMLPFEPNSKPEGVSFYSFSRVSKADGKWGVYVKNVSSLEANTPYLVKVVSGTTSIDFADGGTFKATAGEHVTTEGSWNLVGAYEYKQWLEGDPSIGKSYAFAGSKDNDPSIVGKFSKIAAGAYIYPMRAYLEYRAPAAAGRPAAPGEKAPQSVSASLPENMDVWVIEDSENGEETTRVIGSFNTRTGEFKAAAERYYDMKGRHLGNKKPNVRGIYNNGKKVFVK